MSDIHLYFFGGFRAEVGGKPLKVFESDKARLLLAYLAVEKDRFHRRDHLVGLFWPEKSEDRARHSLSQALSSLNKKLRAQSGNTIFEITSQDVHLRRGAVWADVDEFEDLLQVCTGHAHGADWGCPDCLDRLERLSALYSGDFLAGLSLSGCQEVEDWLRQQRESYRLMMTRTVGWLSQGWESLGDLDKALTYARRQVDLEPLDEAHHRRLMQVLTRVGKRTEALAQFTACQKILAEELAVEPEAETTVLYRQILLSGSEISSFEGFSLTGREALPKLKPFNLPAATTSLVGRQVELERLQHMLLDPACRLLTVLGPGGAGKTSLALEAGRRVQPLFSDGIYLVELDTQQSGLSLLPMVARAVGLDLHPGLVQGSGDAQSNTLEQLCDFLQGRQLFLILDGFEGLLHEASQVLKLLQMLPTLKVMTTSRLRLNLAAEQIFLVQGLTFPSTEAMENLGAYESVQLFVEAARRHDPDFNLQESNREAIAEICRMNQGILLGILLSSVWVDILTPEQIVEAIHHSLDFLSVDWSDLPGRQRSLRGTFDYSWQLLNPDEQIVFLRLSVLHGSFSAFRAEQVAYASLDDLKYLVEASLLQRIAPDHFRMHDLLRQYAQEKLVSDPSENLVVHRRYCQVILGDLAARERRLKSAEQIEVLSEIDGEYADILAAWDWAEKNEMIDLLEKSGEVLWYYHNLRGLFTEGKELCLRLMEKLEKQGLDTVNIRLWVRLGNWLLDLLDHLGELEHSGQILAQMGAGLEAFDEQVKMMPRELAFYYINRGNLILSKHENSDSALGNFQKALELLQAGEDDWDISYALIKNAGVHNAVFGYLESHRLVEQALAIQRKLGDPFLILVILADLGYFYLDTGDYKNGLRVAEERAAGLMRYNSRIYQNFAQLFMTHARFFAGQFEDARISYRELIAAFSHPNQVDIRLLCRFMLAIIDLHTGEYVAFMNESAFSGDTISASFRAELAVFKGMTYLLSSDWDKAEQEFNQYSDHCLSLSYLDRVGQPLALLGYIAYRRGDRQKALDYLEQSLDNGMWKGFFAVFMLALSVVAVMLAEAGKLEQAVELYATITAHPFARNSQWSEDMFGRPLQGLWAGLPPEIISAAQERGSQRQLREVGEEYLGKIRRNSILSY
jgi:DNA-binding SARP family transcriptional activator/predicted ATPase